MFDFLYVKANSNHICKEISLSSFFFRKMLLAAFLLDSRLIISKQCAAATGFLCGFQ